MKDFLSYLAGKDANEKDDYVSADELRQRLKEKQPYLDSSAEPVVMTIINMEGQPTKAISSVTVPKTYWKVTKHDTVLDFLLIKDVSFGVVTDSDTISHILVEWDNDINFNLPFSGYKKGGVSVGPGDRIVLSKHI